jgi:hypothetical protein
LRAIDHGTPNSSAISVIVPPRRIRSGLDVRMVSELAGHVSPAALSGRTSSARTQRGRLGQLDG